MDQFSFINDSDAGADLFCNFQDVCGNEDCSSVFHVAFEKILDFSLHYRIQVNKRFINNGKLRLMQESLGKHQFLPCTS